MIQPVLDPLQSPPALPQFNTRTQLGVIHEFANDRFNILIQIITQDTKQDWAQH